MINLPKLPTWLVGILGTLATLLTAVEPSLGTPWREVAAAVLAILTAAGIRYVHLAMVGLRKRALESVVQKDAA